MKLYSIKLLKFPKIAASSTYVIKKSTESSKTRVDKIKSLVSVLHRWNPFSTNIVKFADKQLPRYGYIHI